MTNSKRHHKPTLRTTEPVKDLGGEVGQFEPVGGDDDREVFAAKQREKYGPSSDTGNDNSMLWRLQALASRGGNSRFGNSFSKT